MKFDLLIFVIIEGKRSILITLKTDIKILEKMEGLK